MPGDGPTTAGSIVGKLKMDRAQWIADVAATKAEVQQLEAADPKIHIDTNAARTIAELEAVATAERVVEARSASLGEQTRRTAGETIRANEANRTTFTRIGMITGAVALLLPLLPALGAGAVGVGTAMLGMGAAGVFALVGIIQQMKQGTALGQQYTAGVNTMRGALSQLSSTAATVMLSSFNRVVSETIDDLPFLNQQIGAFSLLLGRAGAAGASGFLTSLQVMNPLLMTAGIYVEQLALGFEKWTKDGGLEQFTGFALASLPKVIDLLGALATMVLHVLQALAPLGEIGMAVLIGISDVINAIPVDVLGTLIGMVTWGAIAFKAWGFIAPMLSGIATSMGAVGAATTIATGPIGWVVAGLGALAAVIALAASNTRGATAAIADYTYAVQQDNGAIAENVRIKAAQKLVDTGAAEAARKLGIDRRLLLEATLGDTRAQKELNEALSLGADSSEEGRAALNKLGIKMSEYVTLSETVKQSVDEQAGGIRGAVNDYKNLEATLGQVNTQTALQKAELERAAAAAGVSVAAYQAVDSAQSDMAFETEQATAKMYLQNDAAGLLKQTLDLLNGKAISAASAQNRFDSSLANMGAHIDKTGKDVNRATTSLEGMSAAAVANRGELINSVQSAQDAAQAYRDQGASSDEAREKLIAMKDQIIEHAVELGEDRDQVQAFIDKIFQIPESIPPTKIEVDTARADAQIAAFIANVNSRVASIQVRATMPDLNGDVSGSGRPGVALGGTIPGLATGGSGGTVLGRGTAGSDTAGLFRLARGEEVVSNVFGQANRHRGLLKQINAGVVAPSLPTAVQVREVAAAPAASESDGFAAMALHYLAKLAANSDKRSRPMPDARSMIGASNSRDSSRGRQ